MNLQDLLRSSKFRFFLGTRRDGTHSVCVGCKLWRVQVRNYCLRPTLCVSPVEKIISFELFYHKILFIYHLVLVLVQTAGVPAVFKVLFKVLTFAVPCQPALRRSTRHGLQGSIRAEPSEQFG